MNHASDDSGGWIEHIGRMSAANVSPFHRLLKPFFMYMHWPSSLTALRSYASPTRIGLSLRCMPSTRVVRSGALRLSLT